MTPSATRLGIGAVGLAALIAGGGFAFEAARFGVGDAGLAARLEQDVRQRFLTRARQVEGLARQVASNATLIRDAADAPDPTPALFNSLIELARRALPSNAGGISATVYVPVGPAGGYRVLGWSDGPAEDVPPDRLAGPAQLFVAPGTLGPLLSFVQPVEIAGRRVGLAVAQTALSRPASVGVTTGTSEFETAYGPVTISQVFAGGSELAGRPGTFTVGTGETPLLEVQFDPAALSARRAGFRRGVLTLAALPLIGLLLLSTAPMLNRRAAAPTSREFDAWSLAAAAVVVLAAAAFAGLIRATGGPTGVTQCAMGLAALGLATLFPVSWWARRGPRHQPERRGGQFAAEQLLVGVGVAAALLTATRIASARVPTSLDAWPAPIFPAESIGLLATCGLLLAEIAVGWTIAGLLAWQAARWRLSWRHLASGAVAAMLWLAPIALALSTPHRWQPLPAAGLAGAAALAVTFALFATSFRGYYRRTTQAMRLVLVFAAMVLPPSALYPVTAFTAERQARALIETDYARATMRLPDRLQEQLAEAQREIDRFPALVDLVTSTRPVGPTVPSRLAYAVWSSTNLSRARVTSELELYGADRVLVSRFGLNVPDYIDSGGEESWRGASCAWEVFSEVKRFGADDRLMWHAQRALCDASGVRGAVVVHVVPDYHALPFFASANPYREVLSATEAPGTPRLDGLKVVIYGWGGTPVFAEGSAAWPLSEALFDRVRASRDPFWTTLATTAPAYHVYFANDRAFIYAFGFPQPTWFEHTTRLAEITALAAGLFLLLLVGATAYAPLRRRGDAPLRVLFNEIRTSFYRKLYLFFVLAAIGPVVLLALAFGAYISARLQADVEAEAESVVTVARRVFEELAAAQQHPDQPPAAPSDDVMVWIRQVIAQDVNLFRGPRLASTSQRDLFDSGLLPTRTPATVYRAIALNRLPTYVGRDRIGAFQYLIAAAPVPASGRDTVLSVPLALQQREIERELLELNRGVLVAAVVVVLFAAGLGASVAGRVSDPVSRLTRATRQIAAGRLDVRIVADTADELRRLVDDFNTMTETLVAQRAALARTKQVEAWAEMARQVAHEIKNPLTPIQLATEHLERVHQDQGRPLGAVFDQCVATILRQVRLLRQIASEFSTFAGTPTARPESVGVAALVNDVTEGYRTGGRVRIEIDIAPDLPAVWADRLLCARALTNIVENAVQAMPDGGTLSVRATTRPARDWVTLVVRDTGVGMDAEAASRAFEPYFSTKTAGSGLGLANAKRNLETCGGTIDLSSVPGGGTTVTIGLPADAPSTARG